VSIEYTVHRATPPLDAAAADAAWRAAQVAAVDHFHAAGSPHRPVVRSRLLYDRTHLYLRHDVEDRYVVCRATEFQGPVWQDSCVEFFVQPKPEAGYFSFEINCGGTLLSYYIEDPTRTPDGFARFAKLKPDEGRRIAIHHSLPPVVDPEQSGPLAWWIAAAIPLEVLEGYVGPLGELPGQVWRGNFFKCADASSQPHWAAWSPIGEELNFHQPRFFAPLRFATA
jgi:hypothetical protein